MRAGDASLESTKLIEEEEEDDEKGREQRPAVVRHL